MITANKIASTKKPRKLKSWSKQAKIFNCALRDLRVSLGLTLRDVERCGVDKATISRAEQGCEIHLSHALRLAEFFERAVETIWKAK